MFALDRDRIMLLHNVVEYSLRVLFHAEEQYDSHHTHYAWAKESGMVDTDITNIYADLSRDQQF